MILAPGSEIAPEHLHLPGAAKIAGGEAAKPAQIERPADMKTLERTHILETLSAVNGSRKLAAERLGMSERTLRYKLQRLREEGVDPDAGVGRA
jgi:two-component system response regulator FlrC